MIQEATSSRLTAAVARAQALVEAGQDAVVAVLGSPTDTGTTVREYVSFDYWERPGRFEQVVGQQGVEAGATTGTLVAPMIARKGDITSARHVCGPPPSADEDSLLWVLTFDINQGFDIARCLYARVADRVLFHDLELLIGKTSLTEETPGFVLMRALLDHSASE